MPQCNHSPLCTELQANPSIPNPSKEPSESNESRTCTLPKKPHPEAVRDRKVEGELVHASVVESVELLADAWRPSPKIAPMQRLGTRPEGQENTSILSSSGMRQVFFALAQKPVS